MAVFRIRSAHQAVNPGGCGLHQIVEQKGPHKPGGAREEDLFGGNAGRAACLVKLDGGGQHCFGLQVDDIGRDRIAEHETKLAAYAHERLRDLNWLKIYGTAKGKGAIVSFNIDGLHPHDISTIIDRSGVAVRAGHHCAQPLMERLGVTGTCRASFAMYNTMAEVDALAEALTKAHEFFA